MPRALMIYNPNAGRFPPEPAIRLAADYLESSGWALQVESTKDAAHVTELAKEAVREGLDALIVGGGDGSLGLTTAGLLGSDTALGILPTGTANVLARQLNMPAISANDPETTLENARLLAHSTPRAIDVGICNGHPFLLWAGLGFDAMIVAQSELHRSHWKKRLAVPEYFARALWTAHRWRGLACEIRGTRADGTPVFFSGNAQIAVATNIPLYAGGLVQISPGAVMDDAEMDLWLFRGQGSRKVLRHAWNLYRGEHVQDPDVIRLRFSHLTVRSESPAKIHTDGDPHPLVSEVELSIRKKGLKLLIPPTSPEGLFSI